MKFDGEMYASGPTPDQLDKISSGAHIASVLPFVQAEIEGMMDAVRARVFAALNDGTFDANMAEAAWREIHGYHRLLKRLETRVKVGNSVGQRVAKQLEKD